MQLHALLQAVLQAVQAQQLGQLQQSQALHAPQHLLQARQTQHEAQLQGLQAQVQAQQGLQAQRQVQQEAIVAHMQTVQARLQLAYDGICRRNWLRGRR